MALSFSFQLRWEASTPEKMSDWIEQLFAQDERRQNELETKAYLAGLAQQATPTMLARLLQRLRDDANEFSARIPLLVNTSPTGGLEMSTSLSQRFS